MLNQRLLSQVFALLTAKEVVHAVENGGEAVLNAPAKAMLMQTIIELGLLLVTPLSAPKLKPNKLQVVAEES